MLWATLRALICWVIQATPGRDDSQNNGTNFTHVASLDIPQNRLSMGWGPQEARLRRHSSGTSSGDDDSLKHSSQCLE